MTSFTSAVIGLKIRFVLLSSLCLCAHLDRPAMVSLSDLGTPWLHPLRWDNSRTETDVGH